MRLRILGNTSIRLQSLNIVAVAYELKEIEGMLLKHVHRIRWIVSLSFATVLFVIGQFDARAGFEVFLNLKPQSPSATLPESNRVKRPENSKLVSLQAFDRQVDRVVVQPDGHVILIGPKIRLKTANGMFRYLSSNSSAAACEVFGYQTPLRPDRLLARGWTSKEERRIEVVNIINYTVLGPVSERVVREKLGLSYEYLNALVCESKHPRIPSTQYDDVEKYPNGWARIIRPRYDLLGSPLYIYFSGTEVSESSGTVALDSVCKLFGYRRALYSKFGYSKFGYVTALGVEPTIPWFVDGRMVGLSNSIVSPMPYIEELLCIP